MSYCYKKPLRIIVEGEELPRERAGTKIPAEELKAYIQKHPDHVLRKIGAHFGATIGGAALAVKRLGVVRGPVIERIGRKMDSDELRAYIQDNPKATLRIIADHFGVTISAVSLARKRLGIVRNKT